MSIFELELFYIVFHNCKSLHTHLCTRPDTSWHSRNDIPGNILVPHLNKIISVHILPLYIQSYSCLSLASYNSSHTQCQFQHPQSSHTFGTPMITRIIMVQWFNNFTPWLSWWPGFLLGQICSEAQAHLCRSLRVFWHILSPSCSRTCSQGPSDTPSGSCVRTPPQAPWRSCWLGPCS